MNQIINTILMVVILIVGYHLSLNYLAGSKFKVFNYQIKITTCGPKVLDRIEKIEKRTKVK